MPWSHGIASWRPGVGDEGSTYFYLAARTQPRGTPAPGGGTVLVEPDYRRYRIEVNAVAEGDRWNAEVRIRRTLSQEKPHVEIVSNYKLTRDLAELSALTWARRWIDLQLNDEPEPAHP